MSRAIDGSSAIITWTSLHTTWNALGHISNLIHPYDIFNWRSKMVHQQCLKFLGDNVPKCSKYQVKDELHLLIEILFAQVFLIPIFAEKSALNLVATIVKQDFTIVICVLPDFLILKMRISLQITHLTVFPLEWTCLTEHSDRTMYIDTETSCRQTVFCT